MCPSVQDYPIWFDLLALCIDAGGHLICILNITNAGNVRLGDIRVLDQFACGYLSSLEPMAATSCTVSWPVTQAEFDAWDAQYVAMGSGQVSKEVTVMATHPSQSAMQSQAVARVSIPLVARPSMAVNYTGFQPPQPLNYSYSGMGYSYMPECFDGLESLRQRYGIVPGE